MRKPTQKQMEKLTKYLHQATSAGMNKRRRVFTNGLHESLKPLFTVITEIYAAGFVDGILHLAKLEAMNDEKKKL